MHDVVVVAEETTTVDVELALGGRLMGHLLDENGAAIPHIGGGPMIAVCPVPLSTDEVHGTPCNDGDMHVVDASGGGINIDSDGAFTTTRGIEPGTWWVAGIDYSQGPPLIVGDQTSFTVGAGETVVCELRAPGPATCDGTVGAEGDGVSAVVEDGAPNGGDGNGDGTPDSEQANVTSLPAAVGGETYVTVATPDGTTLGSVSTTDPASLPDPPAEVLSFPGGLVSFTVEGVDPGGTVDVELIVHGGVGGAGGYYKYHDGVWEIDRAAVMAEVEVARERFDVVAFWADTREWIYETSELWPRMFAGERLIPPPGAKKGEMHTVAYNMATGGVNGGRREYSMSMDITQREVLAKAFTHDGDKVLAQHVSNVRPGRVGGLSWPEKESKKSPRKIDGAVAMIGARMAYRFVSESPDYQKRKRQGTFRLTAGDW